MAFLKHRPRRLLSARRAPSLPPTEDQSGQEISPSSADQLPSGMTAVSASDEDLTGTTQDVSAAEMLFLEDDESPEPSSCVKNATPSVVKCVVPAGKPDRLDRFLSSQPLLSELSRERIKQAIRAGQCLLDAKPCTDPSVKVRPSQHIVLTLVSDRSPLVASTGPLECIYTDEDIAVVNKPAQLAVHPCPSCQEETLVHRLLHRFPQLADLGGERPGIVHRLDKDTSGLLLVALNEGARLRLSADFADRNIHKVYLALVHGVPPAHGSCNAPLGRHPTVKVKMAVCEGGREALTEWQRLYASPDGTFSLLAIRLHTGRTHQIRVHMQYMGYPLLGDPLYGRQHAPAVSGTGNAVRQTLLPQRTMPPCCTRQMLHAWRLCVHHPRTGQPLTFVCDPPADFWEVMKQLHSRMPRLVVTGCPGCGKSALTRTLGALGYPTWSADADVASLYAPNGEVTGILRLRWGNRFVNEDGSVNKAALLEAMRNEPAFRKELEAIVHPFVYASLEHFWQTAEAQGAQLAIAEVPLWFESQHQYASADQADSSDQLFVVGVACERRVRHDRLRQRRGWSENLIALMDSWQWPEEAKMSACDIVVDNSQSMEALEAQVAPLAQEIQRRATQRQQMWQSIVRSQLDQLHLRLLNETEHGTTENC